MSFILDLLDRVMSVARTTLGKPKLVFRFLVMDDDKRQTLVCKVTNDPSRGWWMRRLGIPRPDIGSVSFQCTVRIRGQSRVIGRSFLAEVTTVDKAPAGIQIPLPVSPLPVGFPLLLLIKSSGHAHIYDERSEGISLSGGVFVATVTAFFGSEKRTVHQEFVIVDSGIALGGKHAGTKL